MAWALDLDGVIWLGDRPIAGSAAAVRRLQDAGERVGFVTNNSFGRRSDVVDKLARHGIDAADGVITSAMAAARLVEPGSRAATSRRSMPVTPGRRRHRSTSCSSATTRRSTISE
jgi:ribonucleotide monophosphatase NagD (HAD superfamily)